MLNICTALHYTSYRQGPGSLDVDQHGHPLCTERVVPYLINLICTVCVVGNDLWEALFGFCAEDGSASQVSLMYL